MSPRLTVERTDYPFHIRALDAAVGAIDGLGAGIGDLSVDSVLDAARRRTGLEDWGDSGFLEPMHIVADNARRLGFTALARVFIRNTWIKAVTNRLLMQRARGLRPSHADVPIRKPIFILGFPRSGTTLLQNLLAQAPDRRGLQFWELITPFPVHADPAADLRRRRRSADVALGLGYLVAPEMGDVHAIGSTTLEECWYLFCNTFCVLNWDLQTGLDDYGRWLLGHDMRPAYAEYREYLQVLLQQRPAEHLLLKCPEHLWFVDALLDVFPDACVVWTHRDPVASIASYCSLMTLPRRMMYGRVVPEDLGALVVERFHEAVTRATAALDRADPRRFVHVGFRELLDDPKGVVHRVVRHFDLEDPPDADARMDAYLGTKRQDEQGKHVYSAARYGVDVDAVHERYADYIRRFDIPTKREHG
ncbi:MAG TPA: sulfotransferase [Myxococcota bacterium]|nr:sulfotransferase [Myxococcota bacterium]